MGCLILLKESSTSRDLALCDLQASLSSMFQFCIKRNLLKTYRFVEFNVTVRTRARNVFLLVVKRSTLVFGDPDATILTCFDKFRLVCSRARCWGRLEPTYIRFRDGKVGQTGLHLGRVCAWAGYSCFFAKRGSFFFANDYIFSLETSIRIGIVFLGSGNNFNFFFVLKF